jgi:citrate/tricarballylate utilization protein
VVPTTGQIIDSVTAKAPAACVLREERRQAVYLDARRAIEICNACRYCEGFCAVFPAMTLRREFEDQQLDYLANLCHNCRGCFYSCQYAPPHEFGINVPKLFSELRLESYQNYAWPRPLAALFRRSGTILSLATIAGIAALLILTVALADREATFGANSGPGSFYAVIPWAVMASVAGFSFLFAILALCISGMRFWRATGGGRITFAAIRRAVSDVATLRNLGGGGNGCNDLSERYSTTRRRFHHAMFYGFLLCFASTSVATLYDHFLGLVAPYPFLSLPVQLGFWGGIGLLVGTTGLAWLKVVGDSAPTTPIVTGGDFALLLLLALTALTGLLLLGLRETGAMGVLLAVHLGTVLTLFLFTPYSKMVHGLYRSLALLRNAQERDGSLS